MSGRHGPNEGKWNDRTRPSGAVTTVQLGTSLRNDEVEEIDQMAEDYGTNRSGIARALMRYGMDNPEAFERWMHEGQEETE